MDHFKDFSEEELLLSESFHNWVKHNKAADVSYWEEWLARHPEKGMTVQNARNMILQLSAEEPDVPAHEVAEAWGKLQQAIGQRKLPASKPKPALRLSLTKWYAVAAVFAGICAIGLLTGYLLLADTYTEHATQFGETKDLVLPDGSQVMLNGNTRLKYRQKWAAHNNREVWLTGEAYFSVSKAVHRRQAKFIVHTDNLDVEVLGTQFNVSNRKRSTQVVLNEGQVKVRPRQDTAAMIMQPGELLKFCDTRQIVIKKTVNPQMYSSWKYKKMMFEETSMRELAERIEFTYGYKVLFADEDLAGRKLTGTIPSDNIDVLLLTLSKVFNLEVRKEKNHILLKSA
jgi:transmembrane sensor